MFFILSTLFSLSHNTPVVYGKYIYTAAHNNFGKIPTIILWSQHVTTGYGTTRSHAPVL